MTRTSFIIGLALSICVHIAFFVPWPGGQTSPPDEEAMKVGKVILEQPPSPSKPEKKSIPSTPLTSDARQVPPPTSNPIALSQVVPVTTPRTLEQGGETALEDMTDEALPQLRILWNSPEEARAVARALGMIIVAVDSQNTILGELNLSGDIRLMSSIARLDRFSNRVRSLPHGFFGTNFYQQADRPIAAIWLLIPVSTDTELADLQREAIRLSGIAATEVRSMDGQFILTRDGHYKLHITKIRS